MSNAAPEIVHQTPTDDPHDWQTPASLAVHLGIAERTVRHRAAIGALERLKTPNGRTYYRQPRQPPDRSRLVRTYRSDQRLMSQQRHPPPPLP